VPRFQKGLSQQEIRDLSVEDLVEEMKSAKVMFSLIRVIYSIDLAFMGIFAWASFVWWSSEYIEIAASLGLLFFITSLISNFLRFHQYEKLREEHDRRLAPYDQRVANTSMQDSLTGDAPWFGRTWYIFLLVVVIEALGIAITLPLLFHFGFTPLNVFLATLSILTVVLIYSFAVVLPTEKRKKSKVLGV